MIVDIVKDKVRQALYERGFTKFNHSIDTRDGLIEIDFVIYPKDKPDDEYYGTVYLDSDDWWDLNDGLKLITIPFFREDDLTANPRFELEFTIGVRTVITFN